jgi:hypothetical protein
MSGWRANEKAKKTPKQASASLRLSRPTFNPHQPIFISKLQIKFAEFLYPLYILSNRVCSTREPVADWSTENEGLIFRFDS